MIQHVNGIDLWYEKAGEGPPVILLHGNGESHEIFSALNEQLKNQYTVFAVDSRGHGKSQKTEELSYNLMVSDITAFIKELDLQKPVLIGFSDGGIVGLLFSIKSPEVLSKLIIAGANTKPSGIKKRWLFLFKAMHFFTRDKKLRLMLNEPQISALMLEKIQIPVLVLAGEKDMISEENTRFIARHIRNSELKILPKEGHGSYVVKSPKLYEAIRTFL